MENILGIWDRLNCKTQLIRLFDLKQFYLTIKTEYRKMKMEKTEFGNIMYLIGPYNYNTFFGGNKNRCKLTIAFKIT